MRNLLGRLEYRWGRYAIENFMAYLCCTMAAVYIMQYMVGVPVVRWLSLNRYGLLKGQIWRAVTFLAVPPMMRPFSALITLYFYYFVGSQLESVWGAFRLNCFYLFGMLFQVIACLISGYADNTFLNLSLFLAFAQLFPEMEVLFMFVIPVKVKYLAFFDWILFAINFLTGSRSVKVGILAAVANFLLFFWDSFFGSFQNWRRYRNTRNNWRDQNRF